MEGPGLRGARPEALEDKNEEKKEGKERKKKEKHEKRNKIYIRIVKEGTIIWLKKEKKSKPPIL